MFNKIIKYKKIEIKQDGKHDPEPACQPSANSKKKEIFWTPMENVQGNLHTKNQPYILNSSLESYISVPQLTLFVWCKKGE